MWETQRRRQDGTFFIAEGSGSVFEGFYPSDAIDAGDLIQCADNAMHRTKEQGLGYQFYRPDLEILPSARPQDSMQMVDQRVAQFNKHIFSCGLRFHR